MPFSVAWALTGSSASSLQEALQARVPESTRDYPRLPETSLLTAGGAAGAPPRRPPPLHPSTPPASSPSPPRLHPPLPPFFRSQGGGGDSSGKLVTSAVTALDRPRSPEIARDCTGSSPRRRLSLVQNTDTGRRKAGRWENGPATPQGSWSVWRHASRGRHVLGDRACPPRLARVRGHVLLDAADRSVYSEHSRSRVPNCSRAFSVHTAVVVTGCVEDSPHDAVLPAFSPLPVFSPLYGVGNFCREQLREMRSGAEPPEERAAAAAAAAAADAPGVGRGGGEKAE